MNYVRLLPIVLAGLSLNSTAEAGRKQCRQPNYCQPNYCQPNYCQPNFACGEITVTEEVEKTYAGPAPTLQALEDRLRAIEKQLTGKESKAQQTIESGTLKKDLELIKIHLGIK